MFTNDTFIHWNRKSDVFFILFRWKSLPTLWAELKMTRLKRVVLISAQSFFLLLKHLTDTSRHVGFNGCLFGLFQGFGGDLSLINKQCNIAAVLIVVLIMQTINTWIALPELQNFISFISYIFFSCLLFLKLHWVPTFSWTRRRRCTVASVLSSDSELSKNLRL